MGKTKSLDDRTLSGPRAGWSFFTSSTTPCRVVAEEDPAGREGWPGSVRELEGAVDAIRRADLIERFVRSFGRRRT